VLIPALQAAAAVGDVVQGALHHVPHVFVVNDGSWDGTGDVARAAGAEVVDHPINLGKGQTLKTGLRYAHRLGFTHAVTLDADGRHDPGDLPVFLDAIAEHPDALVLGQRSAKHRGAFGRVASWACGMIVAVSGGKGGLDPLCGFRSYPLAPVRSLGTRGARYEFDAEVVVRALWADVPVVTVPVSPAAVREGGPKSHFRILADSGRIAAVLGVMVVPGLIPALRPRPSDLPEAESGAAVE